MGVRIAVIDDHRFVCDVLANVCVECGHEVACSFATGVEAVPGIVRERPDLVILDLMLPDLDGFEVAEQVRRRGCLARVLVVSARCDPYTVYRVQKARFHGFIDKGSSIAGDVRLALNALASGKPWFSDSFLRVQQRLRDDPFGFARILSERQQAVLAMFGDGFSDSEIALRMGVKPSACEKHRYRIRRRLGLESRTALIHYARSQGLSSFATWPGANKKTEIERKDQF
jgi:two-component system, NarL family, response regulator NreC